MQFRFLGCNPAVGHIASSFHSEAKRAIEIGLIYPGNKYSVP